MLAQIRRASLLLLVVVLCGCAQSTVQPVIESTATRTVVPEVAATSTSVPLTPTSVPRSASSPLTITPVSAPPEGKYLFVEVWFGVTGSGMLPEVLIDFPNYEFRARAGVLEFPQGYGFLSPADWGYVGEGESRNGSAGSGTYSGAIPIQGLPYSTTLSIATEVNGAATERRREAPVELLAISEEGVLEANIDGERVILQPGKPWQRMEVLFVSTEEFNGSYYVRSEVRNYGWHDRALIQSSALSVMGTTSGGDEWASLFREPEIFADTRKVGEIECPTASTCYVSGDSRILMSKDGGETWQITAIQHSDFMHAESSPISCPDADHCFMVVERYVVATDDGGTTWEEQFFGVHFDPRAIDCPTATTCYVVGWTTEPDTVPTIVATTDGGETWNVQHPSTPGGLGSISCPAERTCWAVGYDETGGPDLYSNNGVIVATTDGGESWELQSEEDTFNLNDVSCPSVTACFAVGDDGVLATADGGMTWTLLSSDTEELGGWEISCPSVTTCYVASNFSPVLVTTDGGRTWTAKAADLLTARYISCPTENTCFATGFWSRP